MNAGRADLDEAKALVPGARARIVGLDVKRDGAPGGGGFVQE
jgi:hypothetical protein